MSERCPRCGTTGTWEACPRCLLETDLPQPVLNGSLELLEEIGRGGMGAVYKARDLRLGRTVAVKLLPPEVAAQGESQTRFEREARALARLNHPNIVAVYDVGREEDQSYIVMEFVDGRPLSKLVPMPVDRTVPIALQVCDALAYAHRQGIVHRDIKPENILVDASDRVKVADFGIARMVHPEGRGWTATSSGEVLGTPHFMAPEALDGAAPDLRMDVYSLGVVLYQMVTGQLPVGHFEPPPAPLEGIVRKALAPLDRRYATIEDLRRDLSSVKVGGAEELPPEEDLWLRSVAMLQSISTGVAIWAFILCMSPKEMEPDALTPLITIVKKPLPNGKILTLARFETWPVFAALATFALAIGAYGFLRWHWRRAGLERPEPDRPIAESKRVLQIGLVACLVYAGRRWLDHRGAAWATDYIPILGGFIEVAALFYLWVTILKAWRVSRPLKREPLMWSGFAIALIPPVIELARKLF